MPLKHTKRKDYLRNQKQRNLPFKVKKPITRRDVLEEPEEGQKALVNDRNNKQS